MASDGDPFPLFHLCDLDFAVSAELIPRLPAFQLALAPWSTAWSPDLEPALKRTWRRKRERARTQITQKAPCGVFAADDDRQKEQFPKFELIPLDFDLSQGEAALDGLTSAQLAAIQFHPSGTKDLAFAAEDIFFSRRERDFAAGLSLPPLTPPSTTNANATATATAPAPPPAVAPAAAIPAPPPAPAAAPAPPAAAAPVQQAIAVPPAVVPAQSLPPAPLAPQPQPTFVPTEAPHHAVQPTAPAAAASSSVAPHAPASAPIPAPAPAAQPTPPLSPGTRQREFERAEYRREINGHESAERAVAAASSSVFRRNGGDRSRSKSRSRSRSRDRDRDRDRLRDRDRDIEKEKEKERQRERDRDRERERERGSRSRRSSRERSTITRDRDRTRRSSRSRERERDRDRDHGRDHGRNRERDRGRDRDWERERSPSRRSSHRDRSRSRSPDRSSLSRRLAEEKRLSVSLKSTATGGGDYPNGEAGSSILSSSSAYRKRSAASPAPSEASSLRSSVRRRVDDDTFGGGAPPQMPLPSEELPRELCASLKTVFMRHFPGQLTAGDVEAWMRTLPPAQSPMAITPLGIKTTHRRNSDRSPNQDPWVTLAFVAFRTEAEAAEVQARAEKQIFGNRVIVASWSHDAGKKSSSWKWSDFTPEFVEEEHGRSLALYAARGSGGGRAGLPPPPTGPLASRLVGAMLPPSAPAGTSISAAELPMHLVSHLHVLYVTNLPRTTSLEECRNFFDVCDNLVGLALQPPLSDYDFASAWLAFEASTAREFAKRSMYGLQYPGTYKKLWLENAEDRARKTGECYVWMWSNMSKDYRQQHAGDHARARAYLPDSPAMNRTAVGGLPSAPPTPYAAAHPVRQRPAPTRTFEPSAAYTSAARAYGAVPPSTWIPGGSAVENQQQYTATTGSEQTYSPMHPLLTSFPPRPPASLVETTPSLYAGLPVPVAEYPTQAAGSAGSHIRPARLAMLQASLSAAGFSSPESPEISTNSRPDDATENMQVDETTRGAWSSARRGSVSASVPGGATPAGSSTAINVKGIVSQAGQGLAVNAPGITSIAPASQGASSATGGEAGQSSMGAPQAGLLEPSPVEHSPSTAQVENGGQQVETDPQPTSTEAATTEGAQSTPSTA